MIIGLTGGMASGKSAAADILKELGAIVICADEVSRFVVRSGKPGYEAIRREYGDGVFAGDGTLNRRALAATAFRTKESAARLNSLLHPLIREEISRRAERARRLSPKAVVVLSAALLLESGMRGMVDELWVVDAPRELRTLRAMERDGLAREAVAARMDRQISDEARRLAADVIIANADGIAELREAVAAQWELLRERIADES